MQPQNIQQDTPTDVVPPHPQKKSKKPRTMLIIAGVLLVAAAVGAIYYYKVYKPSQEPKNPAVTKFKNDTPDLERAVKNKPEDAGARYALANAYYAVAVHDPQNVDKGRLEKAAREYREAIRLDGNVASYHGSLGNTLRDQEKYKEAAEAYQRAIDLNKNSSANYINLATVQEFRLKDDKAALETVTKGIEHVPDEAKNGLRYIQARLYTKTKDTAKARAVYEEVLKVSPDDPVAKYELEQLDK